MPNTTTLNGSTALSLIHLHEVSPAELDDIARSSKSAKRPNDANLRFKNAGRLVQIARTLNRARSPKNRDNIRTSFENAVAAIGGIKNNELFSKNERGELYRVTKTLKAQDKEAAEHRKGEHAQTAAEPLREGLALAVPSDTDGPADAVFVATPPTEIDSAEGQDGVPLDAEADQGEAVVEVNQDTSGGKALVNGPLGPINMLTPASPAPAPNRHEQGPPIS